VWELIAPDSFKHTNFELESLARLYRPSIVAVQASYCIVLGAMLILVNTLYLFLVYASDLKMVNSQPPCLSVPAAVPRRCTVEPAL
jgi:hypothetical protein